MARSLYIVPGKRNIKKQFNKLQNSTRSGFNPAMIFASIIPIPRGKCRIMVVGCCGSLSSVLASDRPETQIHGLMISVCSTKWFIMVYQHPIRPPHNTATRVVAGSPSFSGVASKTFRTHLRLSTLGRVVSL